MQQTETIASPPQARSSRIGEPARLSEFAPVFECSARHRGQFTGLFGRLAFHRSARLEDRERMAALLEENDALHRERDRLRALMAAGGSRPVGEARAEAELIERLQRQLRLTEITCEGAQVACEALQAKLSAARREAAETERTLRNQIAALECQVALLRTDEQNSGCRETAANAS